MQTFNFYSAEGFRLFPCHIDKTPRVNSWRSSEAHIDAEDAEEIAAKGGFVGAWLPSNYVVIDIDRGHKNGIDGYAVFEKLCAKLGVDADIAEKTMAVKTGSGGMHLYFTTPAGTDYRTLSMKALTDAVDVRTHLGYVIAAGTNGYYPLNNVPPAEIPPQLLEAIQTRNKDSAPKFTPKKALPIDLLKSVLRKTDVGLFDTNDAWQEFVTSCIAAAGNEEAVLDAIEEWSKQDENFKDDKTIRKRLETFDREGGITVGTFIHLIKNTANVSKYIVDKVRMAVGEQFDIRARFAEHLEAPISAEYGKIHDVQPLMEAAYYSKNHIGLVEVFAHLVEDALMYVGAEKAYFYFDGNKWVELPGAISLIQTVLINAGQRWYTDVSTEKDKDADEYITAYINYISGIAVAKILESSIRQHVKIHHEKADWDAPTLAHTLTLEDGVMDFSGEKIEFRKGRKDEYRRRCIDLVVKDFDDRGIPERFRAFLKDVFPDDDTRKTATYALSAMLSGTGKFRKFQLWNGAGSNGKSTLMEIMKAVIGERAISYKPEIMLSSNVTTSLTPELAAFAGSLVGFASETEESKRVSQGVVKVMTGNETLTANPKYKDVFEFKTTFQLVLSTNYLPTFSAHDLAFINRILVIPFYTCFYNNEQQKSDGERKGSRYFIPAGNPEEIKREILKERAKILYYLASRYQDIKEGTEIPESEQCLKIKGHYIEDNSDIIQFLEEMVEFDDKRKFFTPTKDLMHLYNEENNTHYSAKYITLRIKEVFPFVEGGVKRINGKSTRGFWNIRLAYGAYPEGYLGNYTQEEIEKWQLEEAQF